MTTITAAITTPSEYITNTDETDALSLDMAAELTGAEAVASAACELRDLTTDVDALVAAPTAFPAVATAALNVVTQRFDARVLAPGRYSWIWNVTLNTGAVRSYRTVLRVVDHD